MNLKQMREMEARAARQRRRAQQPELSREIAEAGRIRVLGPEQRKALFDEMRKATENDNGSGD
jgi:hypothetical protein